MPEIPKLACAKNNYVFGIVQAFSFNYSYLNAISRKDSKFLPE